MVNDRLFAMAKTRVFFKTLSPAKLVKHVLSELIISAANSLLKVYRIPFYIKFRNCYEVTPSDKK